MSVKEIIADGQYGLTVVYNIKKQVAAGKPPKASPRKRRRTTLTPTVVAGLRRHIKATPTKSLRQVAKELSVPRKLVRQVVRESGWRSLRKVKIPLVSEEGLRCRRNCSCLLYTSPSPRDS